MYIAVVSAGQVVTIESNEAASLDTMQVLAARGGKRLVRFVTDARAFVRYSNGESLCVDYDARDGKLVPFIV